MNDMIDRATHYIAAGAVTSPWWLSSLEQISEIAALLLPIAGLCWIFTQFLFLIFRQR